MCVYFVWEWLTPQRPSLYFFGRFHSAQSCRPFGAPPTWNVWWRALRSCEWCVTVAGVGAGDVDEAGEDYSSADDDGDDNDADDADAAIESGQDGDRKPEE